MFMSSDNQLRLTHKVGVLPITWICWRPCSVLCSNIQNISSLLWHMLWWSMVILALFSKVRLYQLSALMVSPWRPAPASRRAARSAPSPARGWSCPPERSCRSRRPAWWGDVNRVSRQRRTPSFHADCESHRTPSPHYISIRRVWYISIPHNNATLVMWALREGQSRRRIGALRLFAFHCPLAWQLSGHKNTIQTQLAGKIRTHKNRVCRK